MFKILLIAFAISMISAKLGGDIATEVNTVDSYKCLKKTISFVIFRAYRSYGIVDPTVVQNIKNAKAGGFTDIDVYIFPGVKCGNPAGQVQSTVKALKGLPYTILWLDIEPYQWPKDKAKNRVFVAGLIAAAVKSGKPVGIYTNSNGWNEIVGNDWTEGSKYKLWWAYWDKKPVFNLKPFAGWKTLAIKQYNNEVKTCGIE